MRRGSSPARSRPDESKPPRRARRRPRPVFPSERGRRPSRLCADRGESSACRRAIPPWPWWAEAPTPCRRLTPESICPDGCIATRRRRGVASRAVAHGNRSVFARRAAKRHFSSALRTKNGAGEGNRTLVCSLGSSQLPRRINVLRENSCKNTLSINRLGFVRKTSWPRPVLELTAVKGCQPHRHSFKLERNPT